MRRVLREMTLRQQKNFWSLVKKTDSCWIWCGYRTKRGYGRYNGVLAHRIAWILEHGPLPEEIDVLHSCDNPRCVNPAHLFPGTVVDNVQDMCQKGRHGRGSWKLDESQRSRIREEHQAGSSVSSLSVTHSVSRRTIREVIGRG